MTKEKEEKGEEEAAEEKEVQENQLLGQPGPTTMNSEMSYLPWQTLS